jgi:hypothetical protein
MAANQSYGGKAGFPKSAEAPPELRPDRMAELPTCCSCAFIAWSGEGSHGTLLGRHHYPAGSEDIDLKRIFQLRYEVQQYSGQLRFEQEAPEVKGGVRLYGTARKLEHPDAELLSLNCEFKRPWTVEQAIADLDETPETNAAYKAARFAEPEGERP